MLRKSYYYQQQQQVRRINLCFRTEERKRNNNPCFDGNFEAYSREITLSYVLHCGCNHRLYGECLQLVNFAPFFQRRQLSIVPVDFCMNQTPSEKRMYSKRNSVPQGQILYFSSRSLVCKGGKNILDRVISLANVTFCLQRKKNLFHCAYMVRSASDPKTLFAY